MKNVFYIVKVNSIYQLREKEGHNVISTSINLDTLLANLFTIVTRYLNTNTFYRKLNNINKEMSVVPMSKKTFSIREKEFAEVGNKYSDFIEETVMEAEKEVEELQPINQIRKNIKRIKEQPKEVSKEKENKGELTISPFNIKYGEIKLYSI